VVLDTGAVTRGSGSKNEDKERNIRKWFVEHDLVDGVILLPDNLFYNTTAAGIIVVLRKSKPKERKGNIVLVNASREFQKGNPKNYMTEKSVKELAEAFLKGQSSKGLVSVVTNEEAAKNDFNLSPSRYLTSGSEASTRSLKAISSELHSLNLEAAEIDSALVKVLAQLS